MSAKENKREKVISKPQKDKALEAYLASRKKNKEEYTKGIKKPSK